MTRTGAPDTLCADGEQVLALTSASATRRSCATEVSTVMLLISAVPLLSSGGRWQQHAHALHHHHDIAKHGDMAVGAVQPLLLRHVQSCHFTLRWSLKTCDTVLESEEGA